MSDDVRPEPRDIRVRQVVEDLKRCHPQRIIVFGSGARGDSDAWSDLDVVVIKATDQPFLQRLKEVGLMVKAAGPIDVFVYTPEEWQQMQEVRSPFAERVLADGRVVYET